MIVFIWSLINQDKLESAFTSCGALRSLSESQLNHNCQKQDLTALGNFPQRTALQVVE